MALAHAIAEHLPYLRRYARALCGTQKSGDAYVRACLEAIVADTSVLDARLSPRVGLYRLFHKLWNSAHIEVPAASAKRGQRTGSRDTLRKIIGAVDSRVPVTRMHVASTTSESG